MKKIPRNEHLVRDRSFELISLTLASKWPPPIGRSLGSRGPRSRRLIRLPPLRSSTAEPPLTTTTPTLGEICRFYQFIAGERGGRVHASPLLRLLAAATQVPFTASNVIIKFAERCLAECQVGRERGSGLVIVNALNEKVCERFLVRDWW